MESKSFFAASGSLPELKIRVIPGHFSTSRSHVNFYLDMTEIKSGLFPARKAAQALAFPFFGRLTETIVCLDGTEVMGHCSPKIFPDAAWAESTADFRSIS